MKVYKLGIFFCLLLTFRISLFSQTSTYDFPSFYPFVSADYYSSLPAELSCDDVFQLGLILSECPLDSLEGGECLDFFQKIKNEVTSSEFQNMNNEEKGKAVLKLLYRDYLKTYKYDQTKINVALTTGTYNCVSSAILYLAAAKAAGLDIRGQKTSEHAFCTVYINRKTPIDVETTNPYGFNPGSKEAIENEDRIKGYYVVPKKNYANRHEASDKTLCGLISANLASFYSKSNNYYDAIPHEALRYEIIKNENTNDSIEARNELDILAGNFMNLKSDSSETTLQKLYWLYDFIEYWGMTSYIQNVTDTMSYNFIVQCYNSRDISPALTLYSKFQTVVTAKNLSLEQELITNLELQLLTDKMESKDKIDFLYSLLIKTQNDNQSSVLPEDYLTIPEQNIYAALENAWAVYLNQFMKSKDFENGYLLAQTAVNQLPENSNIKQMRDAFYNNCIAVIHNNFAKSFNKKNYSEAKTIIEEGLKKFPNDKKLLSDLKTAEEMM